MKNKILTFLILFASFLLHSCATIPSPSDYRENAFAAEENNDIYSPVFIIENSTESYKNIFLAGVVINGSWRSDFVVDPKTATVYFKKETFNTGSASYTNLVYRVHFEKVPFSLYPFYLTTGKNVGIFVVITLNKESQPVLFTTVHTCGCYIAFIPTSYLPEKSFPDKWDKKGQTVFGEELPGLLNYPKEFNSSLKPVIRLRSGTHRVKDLFIESISSVFTVYDTTFYELAPIEALENLPVEGEMTTSFFETSGPRKGYVKKSRKPLERLLMSWWAFDWRIGEDKSLLDEKKSDATFYTSLKPWAREESDMRNFPRFLKYWGWKL